MFPKAAAVMMALAVLVTAGCGKSRKEKEMERAIEKQTGGKADVNISKGKVDMKVKTEDGEMVVTGGGSATIPKDFPEDVFVYKDAKVNMSMTQPEVTMVGLQTTHAVEKVVATYKKRMTSQGWEEKQSVDMGESVMLGFEKGERKVMVTVARADTQTQISITIEK